MEKETKNYVKYINHNPNWLKMITIEIDEFMIDIDTLTYSCKCICNGSKTTVLLNPPEYLLFHVCLIFRNWIVTIPVIY